MESLFDYNKLTMFIKKKNIYSVFILIFLIVVVLLIKFISAKNPQISLPSISKMLSRHLPMDFEVIEACYSPDGTTFTKKKNVANSFGKQSGLLMPDGAILLTGLDFSNRQGLLIDKKTGKPISDTGFLKSYDGWKFERAQLTIQEMPTDFWCWGDPVITSLPNGHFRMYLTDRNKEAVLVSAYSENGYDYVFEGEVTHEQGVPIDAVDFTVLYEKRADKYLIYTRSETDKSVDVIESKDGRHFTRRYTIPIPFTLQFSIIDEGDHYTAWGGPWFEKKPNSDYRYPVKATSTDGINWQLTNEQPTGLWQGNETYCGTYAVIKKEDGYYFY